MISLQAQIHLVYRDLVWFPEKIAQCSIGLVYSNGDGCEGEKVSIHISAAFLLGEKSTS